MRRIRIALLIALVLSVSQRAVSAQDGAERGTLHHAGRARSYVLHLPPGYDAAQPTPLVVVLHGANMTGAGMMSLSGFNTQADEAGALVVYPDAIDRRWQYLDRAQVAPTQAFVDDVSFIASLIDHLAADYAVDTARISVIGFSNGGMLALRLRCSLADRLAGVAAVSGNMTAAMAVHCPGSAPVSTVVILGTQDTVYPWSGYAVPVARGVVEILFSVNQTMTFLALLQGCDLSTTAAELSAPDAATRILSNDYLSCASGTALRLVTLLRFGHEWAGTLPIAGENGAATLADGLWDFLLPPSP